MDATKREIRNLECELAFREATPEELAQGQLGTITGRAICFNAESEILDDDGLRFREVISPEAATMEFLNTQDVKINMLHERSLTFGRSKRGKSGNARLWVDESGVNFDVAVPNCDLGIRARELTKAGVYDGCSFEFYPDKYTIEEREGRVALVRHTKFRAITALTLGMDPAYLQTTLHARELWRETETGKREAEEADAQKVEAEKKAAEEAAEKEAELEEQKAKEDAAAEEERECGGGDDDEAKKKAEEEAKAEEERKAKEEQEARELAEREQKEREAVAVMRMRRNRLALQNRDIETFSY